MKQPKYNIGAKVYHITPESEQGTVIEATYSLLHNRWMYRVTFSIRDNEYDYYEHELIDNIQFKK